MKTSPGNEIFQLIERLYPICRSITGNGVRETLAILSEYIPLSIHEVPSGTEVFDWSVPREWNINDAYIKDSHGNRIVDFRDSNLHVVSYSAPIHRRVSLNELKSHLHTLPDHPEWIPYRTTYYDETWGFCMTHNQYENLKDEEYEVCIDSTLEYGNLSYGELYIPGEVQDEFLVSCHICHPSMGNDNLSGIGVTAILARYLAKRQLRYSYRFVYIPATIGSIAWLSRNENSVHSIKFGLITACLGDPGKSTYKKSRRGNAEIDRIVMKVLHDSGSEFNCIEFYPYGYDERQYCSPGFDLPVGCFMRTPNGKFPEYHTSADNLEFIGAEYLEDSFLKLVSVIEIVENNLKYKNKNPKCEPQLGRRGLYVNVGGKSADMPDQMSILWVLNLSDGKNSLLDIAERSGKTFQEIFHAAKILEEHDLLEKIVE